MSARSAPTIGILGAGYMGLATGLAFAHRGHRVVAYDTNAKVLRALRQRKSPYREEGLGKLLRGESASGRFRTVDSLRELVDRAEGIFLCLPTPRGSGGSIDLAPLRTGAGELARELSRVRGYRLVVVKSTVVPGTTAEVLEPLLREESGKPAEWLGVANNPEFLAEGTMVHDALNPERIVLGVSDRRSARWLRRMYAPFRAPVLELSPSGAELVKYSSNAFLALKVSFANEVARLAERLGENIDDVMTAVGADSRIGPKFLRAGPGFGGSCFDKDVRALVARSNELGVRFRSGESALGTNEDQTAYVLGLVRRTAKTLRGRTVAVLGVSFKAGTDDIRESRAFPIVRGLLAAGARVRLHDPVALRNFSREWKRGGWGGSGQPALCRSVEAALKGVDLAVLQADWPEYLAWPARWTRAMRTPVLVDLRRAVPPSRALRSGLEVHALGVGQTTSEKPGGRPGKVRAARRAR